MKRYVLHRLAGMLVVMFVVVTVVFVIVRIAPGDPAAVMLGPDATPQDVADLRQRLGLDKSLPVQYAVFLGRLLQGDLGESIFLGLPALTAIAQRAETTFFLTVFAMVVATAIALPISIAAAYRHNSLFDRTACSAATLAASVPSFWLGLLLIQQFAVRWPMLPVSGYGGPDADFATRLEHLVLPALSLGIVSSAIIMRFARASMLDVLHEDFVRTARSKGMSEWRVVMHHAFRNALIPILTVLGLTFAMLISGAVVTETVFGLPGVGSLVVSAVSRRDYPVIQAALLVVASLYVLINFAVDMLYLVVDPRVRC